MAMVDFTPKEVLELEYSSLNEMLELQMKKDENAHEGLVDFQMDLKSAYDTTMNHLISMEDGGWWEPLFRGDVCFGNHETFEDDVTGWWDSDEMEKEKDVFVCMDNRDILLSIPHESRPLNAKVAGKDEVTQEDTLNCKMSLSRKGGGYWTGVCDYGKVYIPMKLVHLIDENREMDVSVKYMGVQGNLPWRVFYVHK